MHANILTYAKRKTVYNELIGQSKNGTFCRSICNQHLPNRIVEPMKASAKPTFAKHEGNIAMLKQKDFGFIALFLRSRHTISSSLI